MNWRPYGTLLPDVLREGAQVGDNVGMAYPIKKCAVCGEEFELKPDKPGFANRCPECTETEEAAASAKMDADERKSQRERDAERRDAMRNLLYRKDS